MRVEFVSYDGAYPNLCRGTLVLRAAGKQYEFADWALHSGGSIWFDKDWMDHVEHGPWGVVRWPDDFPEELWGEALDVINASIPEGCCGGCI